MNTRGKFIGFLGFLFLVNILAAQRESNIQLFKSLIILNQDGSLDVTETITYSFCSAKHGISRDFPTGYKDRFGNTFTVSFKLKRVFQDGKPIAYTIRSFENGKHIAIGDPNILISGIHTYTFEYHTERQIGFFKDHDELSWGVTGYGWSAPIQKVYAFVTIPKTIATKNLEAEAYTGTEEKNSYNTTVLKQDHTLVFETTEPLKPHQGLKIFIAWPKGYIQEPNIIKRLLLFFTDNLALFWLLLGAVGLSVYYSSVWRRTRTHPGVIIPLFYPPTGFSPAATRFTIKKGYDSTGFTAEIVDLAVHGFLTIEYQKNLLHGGTYSLHKNGDIPHNPTPEQEIVLTTLFSQGNTITLNKNSSSVVSRAMERANALLDAALNYTYIEYNTGFFNVGLFITGLAVIPALFFLQISALELVLLGCLVALNVLFFFLLQTYTPAGQKVMDAIEGFKLFLTTTEKERFKVIGTPPTRNPELYEKYLPYAIALGVEEQWTEQFVPVFKQLSQEGHPYKPEWYQGSPAFTFVYFDPAQFTSTVAQAASYKISASKTAPGTYSGRGGGGSYGGGGGGGEW